LNRARLQRLGDYPLIAESRQQDFIAIRIQANLFEPEHRRHPASATDAGDADPFAA
jgi:hypothetical protein